MSKTIDQEILTRLLFNKYEKVALTAKETASVLGTASKTLETDRAEAIGIPYTRRNNKEKGQILYSITAIARTILDNQKKTL